MEAVRESKQTAKAGRRGVNFEKSLLEDHWANDAEKQVGAKESEFYARKMKIRIEDAPKRQSGRKLP